MKAKVVHNKLLGGWFVVRGPHQTPIGGRHETKADAVAALVRRERTERPQPITRAEAARRAALDRRIREDNDREWEAWAKQHPRED